MTEPRMFRFALAVCLFLFCGSSAAPGGENEAAVTLTSDGAWCWFQDPRAVYIKGQRERTYAQWMTRDGRLQVGAYDHRSRQVEIHTLKENWDADDHNVGSFLVLPDKRLMVFYARHNKRGLYCRTAAAPESIDRWGPEVTVSDTDRITYNHPVYLSAEKTFYVFWRGPSWKPTFATSKDGKAWSRPRVLVESRGRESSSIRPYLKVATDGKSTIHFTFTDGHPRNEPQNSVYYVRYRQGRFYKADGSAVAEMAGVPFEHRACDVVYDATKTDIRAWVCDVAFDERGRPVIVYTRLPKETDHRYHHAHWDGKTWRDRELAAGGKWFPQTPVGVREPEPHYSGGMALDHADPWVVYLSRPVEGVFEIERFNSSDQGKTWKTTPITSKSKQPNVRPVVPRGSPAAQAHVLWMSGPYQHYTRFATRILMSTPTAEDANE